MNHAARIFLAPVKAGRVDAADREPECWSNGILPNRIDPATHHSTTPLLQCSIVPYFFGWPAVMTPQATRSPELPAGSLILSSALAWITRALPSASNTEVVPGLRVMPSAKTS